MILGNEELGTRGMGQWGIYEEGKGERSTGE